MTPTQDIHRLTTDHSRLESLVSELQRSFEVKWGESVRLQRRYFDSFDWLLFASGAVLCTELRAGRSFLVLEVLDTGDTRLRIPWNDQDPLPEGIPLGPFRDELLGILGARALVPVFDTQVRRRTLRFLGHERKTTVRIHIDEIAVSGVRRTSAAPTQSLLRLVVSPLRGYPKEAEALDGYLNEQVGPCQSPRAVFHHLAGAAGRRPLDTSSRFDVQLDPLDRADRAVKQVLVRLLETIELNEAGVVEQLDVEFLHDFRVAVRRTRSVLGQFRRVFPKQVVRRFGEEFRFLGQATGPLRDMDVYLQRFDGYRSWLPEAVRVDLEPLQAFLVERHHQAHQAVVQTLRSARYRRLKSTWRTFLVAPEQEPLETPQAGLPILSVAARLTMRMYRRAVKQGMAILADPQGPPQALHALRITCKKLRYLMELFRSLYPPDEIKALIGILKDLQDNLGNFQDYTVQQAHLLTFGREMVQAGMAPVETLMAMGRLEAHLQGLQEAARSKFSEVFEGFAGETSRAQFSALFDRPAPDQDRSEGLPRDASDLLA